VATSEIIRELKNSLCQSVSMGLQSGSQRIRSEIMNRHHSNEKIKEISRLLEENKIRLSVDLIFGTPTETPDEMMETLNLCSELKLHSVTPSFFYPFPKTALTEKSMNEGYLTEELYSKVVRGEGSYHTTFLLKHPYKEDVLKFQALAPVYIKSSGFMKKYLKWLLKRKYGLAHRFFHFVSVPLNEFYEFRRRLLMIPRVINKTRKVLKK
jgi:radical SAM superfamily enzyme YgiQ (UPF0313 family)